MFRKMLKNTIQKKTLKVLIVFDEMVADMTTNKRRNPIVINCLLEAENLIYHLILLHNHILQYQKTLN